MSVKKKMRFYFGFRSPYAWLATHMLASLPEDVRENIEPVPYWSCGSDVAKKLSDKGGDILYQPMSRARHFYILQDLRRLTSKFELPVRWPVDPQEPNWDRPHMAYLVAEQLGRGNEWLNAVFKARWQEGRDVCSEAVIAEIAEALDLPVKQILSAMDNHDVQEQAAHILKQAYSDSVFGIPLFIIGSERFWGIDRLTMALEYWGQGDLDLSSPFWQMTNQSQVTNHEAESNA